HAHVTRRGVGPTPAGQQRRAQTTRTPGRSARNELSAPTRARDRVDAPVRDDEREVDAKPYAKALAPAFDRLLELGRRARQHQTARAAEPKNSLEGSGGHPRERPERAREEEQAAAPEAEVGQVEVKHASAKLDTQRVRHAAPQDERDD